MKLYFLDDGREMSYFCGRGDFEGMGGRISFF
jgi:hypothetical protein